MNGPACLLEVSFLRLGLLEGTMVLSRGFFVACRWPLRARWSVGTASLMTLVTPPEDRSWRRNLLFRISLTETRNGPAVALVVGATSHQSSVHEWGTSQSEVCLILKCPAFYCNRCQQGYSHCQININNSATSPVPGRICSSVGRNM